MRQILVANHTCCLGFGPWRETSSKSGSIPCHGQYKCWIALIEMVGPWWWNNNRKIQYHSGNLRNAFVGTRHQVRTDVTTKVSRPHKRVIHALTYPSSHSSPVSINNQSQSPSTEFFSPDVYGSFLFFFLVESMDPPPILRLSLFFHFCSCAVAHMEELLGCCVQSSLLLVLIGVSQHTRLQHMHPLERIRLHGASQLRYLAAPYRADPTIVAAAVERDATAFAYAALHLQDDTDLVLRLTQRQPAVLRFASERIQNDRDVVRQVVACQGTALQFVRPMFQKDRSIVVVAVRNDGMALQHAAKHLQQDAAIVHLAVQSDGRALQLASDKFRQHVPLIAVALRSIFCSLGASHHFVANCLAPVEASLHIVVQGLVNEEFPKLDGATTSFRERRCQDVKGTAARVYAQAWKHRQWEMLSILAQCSGGNAAVVREIAEFVGLKQNDVQWSNHVERLAPILSALDEGPLGWAGLDQVFYWPPPSSLESY